MERLQKVMAQAGIASRRKSEAIILAGRVKVNDKVITELGFKVDPDSDEIIVDGRPLRKQAHVYILFHKPKGVISSVKDPEGRKVVTDFMHGIKQRVYPVGRLDYDTEGLLLLSNDGEFTHLLTHPRHEIPKTYYATVKGVPHGSVLEQLKRGVMLEDGMTAPAEVDYVDIADDQSKSVIAITIHEGRNRQVRRMLEAVHCPLLKLRRVAFGFLTLEGVPRGKYRLLKPKEVKELIQLAKRK